MARPRHGIPAWNQLTATARNEQCRYSPSATSAPLPDVMPATAPAVSSRSAGTPDAHAQRWSSDRGRHNVLASNSRIRSRPQAVADRSALRWACRRELQVASEYGAVRRYPRQRRGRASSMCVRPPVADPQVDCRSKSASARPRAKSKAQISAKRSAASPIAPPPALIFAMPPAAVAISRAAAPRITQMRRAHCRVWSPFAC
jgi:hypothetical protein